MFRHSFTKVAAVAALAGGMAFAQTQTENPQPAPAQTHQGRHAAVRGRLQHLAQVLNLTDSQKQEARTIFQQARQSARPVRQELRQNRQALAAAAKADKSNADIEKLAGNQGRLLGQLVAIRTEASAKFYQMLTPEQRAKADQMHQQFRQRVRTERKNG